MVYRTRKPAMHTAALMFHVPPKTRSLVEKFADGNHISLADAGRLLLEAGAKALGIAEVS